MATADQPRASPPATTLLLMLVVVTALYFGRGIFIPLALSILLSFLLAPIVVRLRRVGLGRITAVLATVALAFTIIFAVAGVVTVQVNELANELPRYQRNIEEKIRAVKQSEGIFDRLTGMVQELYREAAKEEPPAQARPGTGTAPAPTAAVEPIPVEVHEPGPTPFEMIGNLAWTLIGPFATAGIVIVFVIFMLIEREDLRDRLIRLFGASQLHVTTQALDDAAQRVSRYLLMQLIINTTYGIPIGIGLYFIGLPSAALWGLLAILLRFIPYVGPFVAATFPILLAFAVDPGWTMPLLTIGLFLGIELISNNVMEPWLYGSRTGISPLAVLVAAVFWTWLWGPIGLFLSTPLTVCLVVFGRHFPQLGFFSILLGDEPVLPHEARFYQRMLAMDQDEAAELAENFLETHSLEALYDQVVIPALRLAERDRYRGVIDEVRHRYVLNSTRDLVDYLGDREERRDEEEAQDGRAHAAARPAIPEQAAVLCLPARDEADEITAMMLTQVLERRGIAAQAVNAHLTTLEAMEAVAHEKARIVCVSTLPPLAILHARYMCSRLRGRFPALKLVAGLWTIDPQEGNIQKRLAAIPADTVVMSLSRAAEEIPALLKTAGASDIPASAAGGGAIR